MSARYRAVRFCYFFIIFLVVLRLFYWQVLKSDDLEAKAEDQRLSVTDVKAPRGDILFSDGSALASVEPTFLIFAQPKLIADNAWPSQVP